MKDKIKYVVQSSEIGRNEWIDENYSPITKLQAQRYVISNKTWYRKYQNQELRIVKRSLK